MTDPWWATPTGQRRGPTLIRQPLRLALVIGGGLTIAGSFVSWADGQLPGGGSVEFSAMTSPDGVILPIVAAGAIGLALSDGVVASRTRTLQVALAILGGVAMLVWISAFGGANLQIADWQRQLGTGQIGPGIWLAAVGVAILAVSGTILSIRAWRTNGAAGDPSGVVITRASVIRATLEVTGGVVGFVGGLIVGLAAAGPYGLALMAFGSTIGGAAGLAVGNRIGRRL